MGTDGIRKLQEVLMDQALLVSLIYNTALLLSLGVVYELCYFIPNKYHKFRPILSGILIGIIGIAIMSVPFEIKPGLVFDTRSVLICSSAIAFGAVPTIILTVFTALYRIYAGGIGAIPGLAVIVSSALIGLVFRKFVIKKNARIRWPKIYLIGCLVHVVMLACMLLIPDNNGIEVIRQIALPVLIIYPIGTVLLCMLLIHQQERNDALIAIVEAESRYKSMFENSHAVMMIIDPEDTSILDVNPAAARYYGWSADVLRTMKISDINTLGPEDVQLEIRQAVEEKRNHYLFKHRRADGSVRDVEVFSGPIILNGKKLLYSIVHDISERILAEQERLDSEKRFRVLVESAPDAIYIQNGDVFVYVNETSIRLFGAQNAEQLIGTSIYDRYHPDEHASIRKRIRHVLDQKSSTPPAERMAVHLDGTPVPVEASAVYVFFKHEDCVMVFCRDISERKKMELEKTMVEAQLRQKQKLDAIGTLAGGVAHEINNPLNGIMNYAQLVLDETDPDSVNATYLSGIVSESKRISEIVRNLLQFSRQEKTNHSNARMEDIINQTVSLIRTIIKKDQIDLQLDIAEDLPELSCRSQQIQQVLTNLLTNARDTLNEKYPEFSEDKIMILSCHLTVQNGRRWIQVCVEDHGKGILPENRLKIFEPFFSTKPKELGTGLGLAISFGIVQDHLGYFKVESEVGQYSKFCLYLPVDADGQEVESNENGGSVWQES
jgi:PAS domain S-box-containing protein